MGVQDHGGFDLVIALNVQKLSELIGAAVNKPAATQSFNVPEWGTLQVSSSMQLTSIVLAPDGGITTTITASVRFSWPELKPYGVHLDDAGQATFSVTVAVTGTPKGVGTELRVEFDTNAVTVTIPPGTLEQIPAVQAYLAALRIFGTQTVENARHDLYTKTTGALDNALELLLPNVLRLGRLPRPPVTDVRTSASGSELRFLMTIGGSVGNPSAITRSRIQSGDLAAVVLNNTCLLRDVVRPSLAAALSLPSGGFISGHPCFWAGSASFAAGSTFGITPNLRTVRAGIDAAGMLHVIVTLDGSHSTGAFGIDATLDVSIGGSVAPSGSDRRLQLAVSSSATTSIDMWVAWWVYVGGIFVSPLATLAVALTDAFAGGSLAGGLNSALRGALSQMNFTLPIPDGPLSVSGFSMAQSDAPLRTFSFPGMSWLTIPDFPMNDVIVRFSA